MEMVGIANAKNEEIYWLVLKRLKTVKRKWIFLHCASRYMESKGGEVLEKGQQKGRHINGGDLQKKVRLQIKSTIVTKPFYEIEI